MDGDKGQERRRERESPSKQRSLNDPETVRMNAKKALFQTLWRRSVCILLYTYVYIILASLRYMYIHKGILNVLIAKWV